MHILIKSYDSYVNILEDISSSIKSLSIYNHVLIQVKLKNFI